VTGRGKDWNYARRERVRMEKIPFIRGRGGVKDTKHIGSRP